MNCVARRELTKCNGNRRTQGGRDGPRGPRPGPGADQSQPGWVTAEQRGKGPSHLDVGGGESQASQATPSTSKIITKLLLAPAWAGRPLHSRGQRRAEPRSVLAQRPLPLCGAPSALWAMCPRFSRQLP